MPGKSAPKKATPAKETAPAATKAPRVSSAKHRTKKLQENPVILESAPETGRELIASIAYGYWESRGRQGGDPVEDWLRAEKECLGTKAAAAAPGISS